MGWPCRHGHVPHAQQAAGAGAVTRLDRQALRQALPLPDAKLESLLAAGYSQQNALEVVLGIAMKVMSNYSNHLVRTPLDAAFQAEAIEA